MSRVKLWTCRYHGRWGVTLPWCGARQPWRLAVHSGARQRTSKVICSGTPEQPVLIDATSMAVNVCGRAGRRLRSPRTATLTDDGTQRILQTRMTPAEYVGSALTGRGTGNVLIIQIRRLRRGLDPFPQISGSQARGQLDVSDLSTGVAPVPDYNLPFRMCSPASLTARSVPPAGPLFWGCGCTARRPHG